MNKINKKLFEKEKQIQINQLKLLLVKNKTEILKVIVVNKRK